MAPPSSISSEIGGCETKAVNEKRLDMCVALLQELTTKIDAISLHLKVTASSAPTMPNTISVRDPGPFPTVAHKNFSSTHAPGQPLPDDTEGTAIVATIARGLELPVQVTPLDESPKETTNFNSNLCKASTQDTPNVDVAPGNPAKTLELTFSQHDGSMKPNENGNLVTNDEVFDFVFTAVPDPVDIENEQENDSETDDEIELESSESEQEAMDVENRYVRENQSKASDLAQKATTQMAHSVSHANSREIETQDHMARVGCDSSRDSNYVAASCDELESLAESEVENNSTDNAVAEKQSNTVLPTIQHAQVSECDHEPCQNSMKKVKRNDSSFYVTSKRRKAPRHTSQFQNAAPIYMEEPIVDNVVNSSELVERADEMRKLFFSKENPTCPSEVREMYISAANSGNPDAMVRLVEMNMKGAETVHPDGKRIEASIARCDLWLKKLQRFKNDKKYAKAILILEAELLVNKKKPTTKELEEAEQKYIQAYQVYDYKDDRGEGLYKLGVTYYKMYQASNNVTKRECLEKCAEYLTESVSEEHGDAAVLLGSFYDNAGNIEEYGELVHKLEGKTMTQMEREKAAKDLYFDSSHWGSAKGFNDSGTYYELAGGNVEYSFDMAAENYRKSFELGFAAAATNLGLLYEFGGKDGRKRQNYNRALKWYELGYRVRCPNATLHLGMMYDYGIRARNVRKAVGFYETAMRLSDACPETYDIGIRAKEHLDSIIVTSVILDDETYLEAFEKIEEPVRKKLLQNCVKKTQWIIRLEVDPGRYARMPSAMQAVQELNHVLGDQNGELICDEIARLATYAACGNPIYAEEAQGKLRRLMKGDATVSFRQ